MTLDDVYGAEHDRFPLEQERKPMVGALEWTDRSEEIGSAEGGMRRVVVLLQAPWRAA